MRSIHACCDETIAELRAELAELRMKLEREENHQITPTMHPTETEKAQQQSATTELLDNLKTWMDAGSDEIHFGTLTLDDNASETIGDLIRRAIEERASIPDPASAVPALVGALEKIAVARCIKDANRFHVCNCECCAVRSIATEALALAKGGKR